MSTTITTYAGLVAIADDLTADYVLGNDIECSGNNFTPLGTFSGSLDGQGFSIKNLTITINASGDRTGALITTNSGTVENLKLTDCDISITSTSRVARGATLVYTNNGIVDNCSATGTITCTGETTYNAWSYAGGLVCINMGTLTDSYSTVTVTAEGESAAAAGLCFYNMQSIARCYATGNAIATATDDAEAAGLVCENEYSSPYIGEICDSYAKGNSTATSSGVTTYAAGCITENYANGTVSRCYSTGTTTATTGTGGFCAINDGTVEDCFWDTQTSGDATSDGGTGKTTAQMKTESTFTDADWNFKAIWDMLSTVNDGYPYLLTIKRPPYTTPVIYDEKGRITKGARIEARRNDTGGIVETEYLGANGTATFTELPNDVGITFYATWGGSSANNKSVLLFSTIIGVAEGGTGSSNAETARTNLGLKIGTDVQAWDNDLDDIAALTPTDSNIMVGDGTDWVAESGDTARTSLGVGTGDSPQFTAVNVGHATDTTVARSAAGRLTVEGVNIVRGPASVTDNRLVKFDLTTGDLIQQTGITADDSNNVSGVAKLTTSGAIELGNASDTTIARESAGKVSVEGTVLVRPANYVVAANGAPTHVKAQADYVCDATDDHVQIQAAIDALPATGGKVLLTEGTFNIESSITLDSYQTLQGMGRSTILTTTTADLDIITAIGGSGTEKVGITIADLQVDGGAGSISDCGIYFEYVDYSLIQNVYSRRHAATPGGTVWSGIYLLNSDFNQIIASVWRNNVYGIYLEGSNNNSTIGNICQENEDGINLYDSSSNTITDNICEGNAYGIYLSGGSNNANTISSNKCQGNNYEGVYLDGANNNTILDNTCQGNGCCGIYLGGSNNNIVMGNSCFENSQTTDNTSDDILLDVSDYNLIASNLCRAGGEINKPKYGINISNATCDGNKVINNDLYDDGFGTAPYNDDGTGTIYVEPGIDDTPVNGETGQPISSNWAYDHVAAADPHTGYRKESDTDYIDKTHLSQDFGASATRLRNIIVSPIAGEILRIAACSGTAFSGLINGNPTATSVVYDGDSNEDMFSGLVAYTGSTYWGQIILHNKTRSNSRKIVSVDRATNTITTTSSADDWADNDAIDCESQTVEGEAAIVEYVDVDVSDFVGAGVEAIILFVALQNQTADYNAVNVLYLHPYITFDYGKRQWATAKLGNDSFSGPFILSVVDQKITICLRPDCSGSNYIVLSVKGTIEYADT